VTSPLIGINLRYRPACKCSPAFSYVACDYPNAIYEAGGIPMFIPPLSGDALAAALRQFDGILMTGGDDLDCRNDGWMLHETMRLMDPVREKFDRQLMKQVAKAKIPLLAVGVGMQLLNVTMGGNLLLHIPSDVPRAIPHRDDGDPDNGHSLEVVEASVVGRAFRTQHSEGFIRVNSLHHQAVDEVADGFRVTARCPDGVVEAIESTDPIWWAVGVQFHPEKEQSYILGRRIFEEFVQEAKKRRGPNSDAA
jgi:putative glutamine amidotransferase